MKCKPQNPVISGELKGNPVLRFTVYVVLTISDIFSQYISVATSVSELKASRNEVLNDLKQTRTRSVDREFRTNWLSC